VQSCDNLRGNGDVTRDAVLGLAALSDPALAEWIAETCSFPNAMVDCIVPATGPEEVAAARALGVADAAPVTHENFRQWVMEDAFCAGRPEWERVGVTFTDDVHAYETMKIRILNAGHQLLANAGELLGLGTVADCMAHPLVSGFWRRVEMEEIVPHVSGVPGMSAARYVDLIETRFANPAIRDTTRRIAFDGSARHAGFVLPILRDALAAGAPMQGLALAEALWARMCAGRRDDGTAIAPNDPHWESLQPVAEAARSRPAVWLEQEHVYGALRDDPRMRAGFEHWLRALWRDGTARVLSDYSAGQGPA
jgi:mannitol 2-dehydrogenase